MIVYGINPLMEALNSRYSRLIKEVIVSRDKKNNRLVKLLEEVRARNIKLRFVDRNVIRSITKTDSHQGVAFELEKIIFQDIEDVVSGGKNIVLCDSLQDPNNLGSIFRSALLFGFDVVVITKDRSVGITPNVIKVSTGAVFHLEIVKVINLSRTIEFLRSNGYMVVGLDAEGEMDISELNVSFPIGLVVGSEGEGIRSLVRRKCDVVCRISTTGKLDSLNAAIASAIAMYEIFKKIL
ncbi:MAG: 23S rRNA (guanosine(2251)-2'-O)-methyltransferase RlmB [Brevinematia bacterium]